MSIAELHRLGMVVDETIFHDCRGQEVVVGLHTAERNPLTDKVELLVEIDGAALSLPVTSALLLARAIESMVGKAVGFPV